MKTTTQSCIVYDNSDRMIVDTRLPNANMMNDATRPFAVCRRLHGASGRVTCIGRYETLTKAKSALRYLQPSA